MNHYRLGSIIVALTLVTVAFGHDVADDNVNTGTRGEVGVLNISYEESKNLSYKDGKGNQVVGWIVTVGCKYEGDVDYLIMNCADTIKGYNNYKSTGRLTFGASRRTDTIIVYTWGYSPIVKLHFHPANGRK